MDQFVSQIFTFGTLLLACSIFIFTYFVRKFVELALPSWKKQAHEMEAKSMYLGRGGLWWNEFVLPLIPVLLGWSAGFTDAEFLYGPLAKEKLFLRLMWGGGVGWFSGVLYKGAQKAVYAKTGINIDPSSSMPPSA